MIIKANKQIGFIYKDNESIDKILKDGDVVFERGFLREKTSTTLPITFGGVGKNLKDYRVYGNTVQNGTPTPDTPIDMVSCGDRTKNLYNNDTSTKTILSLQGVETENDSWTTSDYIKIKKNLDYIFSWQPIVTSNFYWQTRVSCYDSNKQFISGENLNSYPGTNKFYQTITNIPENTEYIRISFSNRVDSNSERKNVQLEEGSVNTSYEPYGYKIPVNVRSDNLFNKDNTTKLNGTISVSYDRFESGGLNCCIVIPCKSNTTYTVEKRNDGNTNRFALASSETIPSSTSGEPTPLLNKIRGDASSNLSLTTGLTANYLIVQYYRTAESVLTEQQILDSIMIIEGSTAPSKYIPYYNQTTNIYLDEPLRKIDGYSDYIDFINGKVVRNIKEVVLDGSESWFTAVTRNSYNKVARQFLLGNAILNQGNSSNITKSTNFRSESANNIYSNSSIGINCIGISDSGYLRIGLDLTVFPGDNSFKTWLSENNVTVDYVLATPTEESITLPNIPTIDGNNTLNIETEITPSQVYIKYKSNT